MFVNINVKDVEIVSLKQRLDGWNGGTHHALWLNPRGAVIFDGGDDFPTVRHGIRLVSNENGAGAVVERAGVSCGDPAFLVEDGTQVRQRFIRRVTPHALVRGKHDRIATALWNLNRKGLPVKPSVFPGFGRSLLAAGGKGVHGPPVNGAFVCNRLAGGAHVDVVVDVPQAIVNHRIDEG